MPNLLEGPCPHCSGELYIQTAVLSAPPGFAGETRTLMETMPTTDQQPERSDNGDRPTCPQCGSPGRLLEQVVKKPGKNLGRRFTAYTCGNEEGAAGCSAFGDTIPGTFRWAKVAA